MKLGSLWIVLVLCMAWGGSSVHAATVPGFKLKRPVSKSANGVGRNFQRDIPNRLGPPKGTVRVPSVAASRLHEVNTQTRPRPYQRVMGSSTSPFVGGPGGHKGTAKVDGTQYRIKTSTAAGIGLKVRSQ